MINEKQKHEEFNLGLAGSVDDMRETCRTLLVNHKSQAGESSI